MRNMTLYVAEAKSEPFIHELEALLLAEPGVERALVVVEDGKIKLELDEIKIKESHIVQLIEEAGYHIA
ncbi:hypothetical protein [Planococcus dechangensis]|uniref:HMA domain-containing protein n=1 Tax=Planococcus dechangensis TaxID=1176255 RepID=A0ABV9MCJ2_9BACL